MGTSCLGSRVFYLNFISSWSFDDEQPLSVLLGGGGHSEDEDQSHSLQTSGRKSHSETQSTTVTSFTSFPSSLSTFYFLPSITAFLSPSLPLFFPCCLPLLPLFSISSLPFLPPLLLLLFIIFFTLSLSVLRRVASCRKRSEVSV